MRTYVCACVHAYVCMYSMCVYVYCSVTSVCIHMSYICACMRLRMCTRLCVYTCEVECVHVHASVLCMCVCLCDSVHLYRQYMYSRHLQYCTV